LNQFLVEIFDTVRICCVVIVHPVSTDDLGDGLLDLAVVEMAATKR
jgi:hypothetical protein